MATGVREGSLEAPTRHPLGHEKDAFTGASQVHQGLFETAKGGVILLDEIGEMPLAMQAKLLRVLEGHSKGVTSVAIHPNESLIASASLDGTVRLWNTSNSLQHI